MTQKASGFLRREFRFLHKPLNLRSRLCLLAAAITIAVSIFFPLWKMHLVAPQYSAGLDLHIFSYKIHGGGLNGQHLVEINNLNHYIGMKREERKLSRLFRDVQFTTIRRVLGIESPA